MIALVFFAVMKWYESYDAGVSAVRAKSYQAGADALSAAIAEMPNELAAVRAGKSIITYTPHFWLGIARYNLGDIDGALREFKTSEEQGVVQNTPYYAQLRDWVARANGEKQRRAEGAAAGSKREANAAVGRALSAQTDAMSAGADRSDAYRAAQRKLQEALDTNARAGTDVHAYKRAADLAAQARDLFAGAAAEAKKKKEERPQPLRTVQINVPFEPAPVVQPAPPPPPVPVESEASVEARIAAQNEKRRQIEAKTKPIVMPKPIDLTMPLESAYRAFAAGDFRKSDALLTQILATRASAEAYLLRGCARYTEATLMRGKLDAATDDFRKALELKPALRLDRGAFSPKLVAYFDQTRSAGVPPAPDGRLAHP